MSLIIKDKIAMLMKGFPTVSDKYNLTGGTLAGTKPVQFGELVKFSATKGYYEAITAQVTIDQIAGFVMGTNVKLNELWPEGQVQVNPGEAFNLTLPGTYMAIEVASDATEANIAANKKVFVDLTTGKLTTSDKTSETVVELPNVVFTGTWEDRGTATAHKYLAEILIK